MSADTTKPFSAVRAICIGSVLLVVGAFWVVVQEILLNAGNISANAPPVGAVGLFLGVLTIAVLLGVIRRRWALDRRELLLIYCMLITFFPLASQGLWQRFVGTMISARTFTAYTMPMPRYMVPQGADNLIRNPAFEEGLEGWEGDLETTEVTENNRPVPAALFANNSPDSVCDLKQFIPRRAADGTDLFGPGQVMRLEARIRPIALKSSARFRADISVDDHRWEDASLGMPSWLQLSQLSRETVDGTGLETMIAPMVKLPYGMGDGLWLRLRLIGEGQLALAHISCISNEGAARLLEGSEEIDAAYFDAVPRDGKARLFSRPSGFWPRLKHTLTGYIPWDMWRRPLLSWGLLWTAMFFAMYAVGAILFRQWSEHEKLTFPLTVLPLALTEPDADRPGGLPKILRSRALWAGVATACVVYVFNGLHFYNNNMPGFPTNVDLAPLFAKPPGRALLGDGNGLVLRIVLLGIGVAYFMDLNMSFNLWFFFVACKLWMLIPFYRGTLDLWAWEGGPSNGQALWYLQGIGSAIGIVLIALWLARKHLWRVLQSLWQPRSKIDDANEPLPYRGAILLLLTSIVLLAVWGHISGAGWWFGVWGMGLMLAFAMMAARVRAECAAPGMWIVPAAPVILLIALGSMVQFGVLPISYMVLIGSFMCVGYFLMIMPALMETFQIARLTSIPRRAVLFAMMIGFVVAVASGGYMLLNWGYAQGLTSMRGSLQDEVGWAGVAGTYTGEGVLWRFRLEQQTSRDTLSKREAFADRLAAGETLNSEEQKTHQQVTGWQIKKQSGIAGLALLFTCLLGGARLLFLNFPFHPVGYALATTQVMTYFWFSIFLAWLARFIGLRLGGVRFLKEKMQPYMIGLIVGSVLALLLWDLVGVLKIMNGFTGKVYVTW
jgi:hypothetical protein